MALSFGGFRIMNAEQGMSNNEVSCDFFRNSTFLVRYSILYSTPQVKSECPWELLARQAEVEGHRPEYQPEKMPGRDFGPILRIA